MSIRIEIKFKIMEKFFNKTNILILIIIGLVVLNISMVSTIIWHRYHDFHERWGDGMAFHRGRMEMFIPEKLKLDSEQKLKFYHIDSAFRKSSFDLAKQMHEVRFKILLELKKPKVDTFILLGYSKEIGNMHAKLKMNTIEFYIEMKKICSPVQQDSLAGLFQKIIEFGDLPGPPSPHRHGRHFEMRPSDNK